MHSSSVSTHFHLYSTANPYKYLKNWYRCLTLSCPLATLSCNRTFVYPWHRALTCRFITRQISPSNFFDACCDSAFVFSIYETSKVPWNIAATSLTSKQFHHHCHYYLFYVSDVWLVSNSSNCTDSITLEHICQFKNKNRFCVFKTFAITACIRKSRRSKNTLKPSLSLRVGVIDEFFH